MTVDAHVTRRCCGQIRGGGGVWVGLGLLRLHYEPSHRIPASEALLGPLPAVFVLP